MKSSKSWHLVLMFSAVQVLAQDYSNAQINMMTELNNTCRHQGGGPNFCACFSSTTTKTLSPADYIIANAMEKKGLSTDRTRRASAVMDSSGYICSSLFDPRN